MPDDDSLEHNIRRAREDAAAARVLAAGADRDVHDVRTEFREYRRLNQQLHNATRADLADLRERVAEGFASVDERFASVEARCTAIDGEFAKMNHGFAEMRAKLDATAAGHQQIVGLLTTVIDRLES
ncbi:hypothetical protein [Smaragdicoccus niigatensis]|uniref:hypothetical protein n=1 Tax=Smaragdicoccus niigatensis TaxID=359359 RepID=UPI0003740644|nr:hypothetical protein [Smaragdicoccus niigatensis]